MNTDVKNAEGIAVHSSVEETKAERLDVYNELIWEKKKEESPRRFTPADLWNIRRNTRSFSGYRRWK